MRDLRVVLLAESSCWGVLVFPLKTFLRTHFLRLDNKFFSFLSCSAAMTNFITGTNKNDFRSGTFDNDSFSMLLGDDTLKGSFGNDTLNGGLGFDTADYTALGATVTLGALGALSKGAFGTDRLISIELVKGSALAGDTIDLSGAISGGPVIVTGASVNLSTPIGTVVVNGTGGGLPVSVKVQSFEDVLGTIYGDSLIGSAAANTLNGDAGNDFLDGQGGNDLLLGGEGSDGLVGGNGADTLIGGAGKDKMSGGSGFDRFSWSTKQETAAGSGDVITDFKLGDILDFQLVDAKDSTGGNQAFKWIGSAAFTAEGQLRFQVGTGGLFIQGNTLGSSTAELEVFLAGVSGTTAGLAAVGLPSNIIL
jgi:Ca2+-binding RTX toxin-like protein